MGNKFWSVKEKDANTNFFFNFFNKGIKIELCVKSKPPPQPQSNIVLIDGSEMFLMN